MFIPANLRGLTFFLVSAFLGLVLESRALAQAAPASSGPTSAPRVKNAWVIPAGKDELLTQILAGGQKLPGDCEFADGKADLTSLSGTYKCPGGSVVVQLTHPTKAAGAARKTERFAITVQSGSPPAGLMDALTASVRAHEKDFEWTWIGEDNVPPTGLAGARPLVIALLAVVMVGGVALLVMRRRRQRPVAGV